MSQLCDIIGLITPDSARLIMPQTEEGGCLDSVFRPQVASVWRGPGLGGALITRGRGSYHLHSVCHITRHQISEFQSKYLLLPLLNDPPQRADFSRSHPASVIGFLCPNCFVSCICNRRRNIKWDLRQTNPNISHLLLLSWGFSGRFSLINRYGDSLLFKLKLLVYQTVIWKLWASAFWFWAWEDTF